MILGWGAERGCGVVCGGAPLELGRHNGRSYPTRKNFPGSHRHPAAWAQRRLYTRNVFGRNQGSLEGNRKTQGNRMQRHEVLRAWPWYRYRDTATVVSLSRVVAPGFLRRVSVAGMASAASLMSVASWQEGRLDTQGVEGVCNPVAGINGIKKFPQA